MSAEGRNEPPKSVRIRVSFLLPPSGFDHVEAINDGVERGKYNSPGQEEIRRRCRVHKYIGNGYGAVLFKPPEHKQKLLLF